MNKLKAIVGIVAVVLLMPMWFYLLYQVLVRVEASELMWFIFWAYVPLTMLASLLTRVAEASE